MSDSIGRDAIRAMVEEFWRSFLAVAKQNPQIMRETILHFEERIQATAALMPKQQAAMHLQVIDEEREILFREYERSPDALKRRLGLAPTAAVMPIVIHRQQSLGEMAARTAIRATILESVYSLFRLFR